MAEPLVFIPGMMCDARLFGPQIAELSAEFSVTVAPITRAERIEKIATELLDELPRRSAVVGHGMGGMVAMELMRCAPNRISRVALMDTSPLADTPQDAAERDLRMVRVKAGNLTDVLRDDVAPDFLAPGPRRPDVMSMMVEMGAALGPDVYRRQSRAMQRRRDQQGTLRRCKTPAMVICGQHDTLYPPKRHAFMAELIPFAELRVIPDAGLLPMLEQPAQTTAILREWLAMPLVLR